MELRELIKAYREEHGLSQRQFAAISGLSNGYISMVERGMNPKTKQPVTPTLPALKKLSDAMGLTLSDMLAQIDDMPIDLTDDGQKNLSALVDEGGQNDPLDIQLASLILSLSHESKLEAVKYLQYLASQKDD